jgi:hypothetical protein
MRASTSYSMPTAKSFAWRTQRHDGTRVGSPAPAVRAGHVRALEMIENLSAFKETIALYEAHLGNGNVYFRPTEKGLTVMSLDHEGCASMIGVSGRNTGDEYLDGIPPSAQQVAIAYAGYCSKRDSLQRRSEEERFALRCIRHALGNGLRLPNTDWYFIHQEWRFPSGLDVGKLDLLAVDAANRRLVVIELKDSEGKSLTRDRRGRTAAEQAATYADLFVERRTELYPFFRTSRSRDGCRIRRPRLAAATRARQKSAARDSGLVACWRAWSAWLMAWGFRRSSGFAGP